MNEGMLSSKATPNIFSSGMPLDQTELFHAMGTTKVVGLFLVVVRSP